MSRNPLEQVIYDVDDGHILTSPENGVPHADPAVHEVSYFRSPDSAVAHNPYSCFGAPGVAWPRGYPLSQIEGNEYSTTCGVGLENHDNNEVDGGRRVDGRRSVGVVQALANNDPDVDAIYRLTHPLGQFPFTFDEETAETSQGGELHGVPSSTFSPYNDKVERSHLIVICARLLCAKLALKVSCSFQGILCCC